MKLITVGFAVFLLFAFMSTFMWTRDQNDVWIYSTIMLLVIAVFFAMRGMKGKAEVEL